MARRRRARRPVFRAVWLLPVVMLLHPIDDWRGSFGRAHRSKWIYFCTEQADGCTPRKVRTLPASEEHGWPKCRLHGRMHERPPEVSD